MEQLILFAVGVPVFMLVWRFIVQRTILDNHRDKLFDLRDELRESFARHDALDSTLYKELRDLINSYLRNTEELNIWGMAYIKNAVNRDKALKQHLSESLRRRFRTDNPALQVISASIRKRAYETGVSYMVLSSLFCTFLAAILIPILALNIVVKDACSKMGHGVKTALEQFRNGTEVRGNGMNSLWIAARAALLALVISPAAIEAATPPYFGLQRILPNAT